MNQNQVSLNNGMEGVVTNSSPLFGEYLSRQYVEVKNLTPRPTEWRPDGKPIYDRLPAASERYKLNFAYDDNTAYTYIPIGGARTGVGSMYVQASGENKYLVIQGGNLVWKYGTIPTVPLIIDLQLVGMSSAKFLLAYQLYYDDSPIPAQYMVKDMPLSGMTMDIRSGTDGVTGWRYTPQYAFLGLSEKFWSNYDGLFPSYNPDAFLSWQLPLPCSFTEVTLRCPPNTSYSGTATLSYMACSDAESTFCQEPEWTFEETVQVSKDSAGQYYKFTLESPTFAKGWRVEWSDSKVSIQNVLVSGTVTQAKKPATMYTNYGFVVYPANSVPTKFTNDQGKEIPLIMCKLAYVDVNSAFEVEKVQDIREIVYTSYEPIAEWLTRTWDNDLIDLFYQFSNFSEFWMNPGTSMYNEYLSLSESEMVIDFETCPDPNYQQYADG